MNKLLLFGVFLPIISYAGFVQENVMKPKKHFSACFEQKLSLNDYKSERIDFFSSLKFECKSLPTAVVCVKDKGNQILSFNYFETEIECLKHLKNMN